ncbi:MAG: acyl carrier protein [Bacteroidales bacterium]|nr:acyl carrier protein [Bacteroidales bacterium]
MTIEEFILRLEHEFDHLPEGRLKPTSNFREEVEWNSIHALILIALVKTEYDVTVTATDLLKFQTVEDIYSFITSRQKA